LLYKFILAVSNIKNRDLAISLFNGDVRIYCDAGINKGRLKSYAGDQALLAISKYYT
jgi:hypothetical protein